MDLPSALNFPITSTVFEVSDGVLIIVLGVMFLFACVHLITVWNDCRLRYPGRGGAWRCILGIYYERAPSVAITVIVGALWLRFLNLWHLRHITNHRLPQDVFTHYSFHVFALSYVMLVWGVICWIRNISPFRIANWEWLLILAGSTALSLWWSHN